MALKQNGHNTVVYVGSSEDKTLLETVFAYCIEKSEIEDLLTDAILSRYSVFARMKKSESETSCHHDNEAAKQDRNKEAAKQDRNSLLNQYDYAWNMDRNAVRNILSRGKG